MRCDGGCGECGVGSGDVLWGEGAGGGASGFKVWVGGGRLGVWFRRVNDAGQFKDFK